MTAYVVHSETGRVHRADCRKVQRGDKWVSWDPEKQHLSPECVADPSCLPDGLPLRTTTAVTLHRPRVYGWRAAKVAQERGLLQQGDLMVRPDGAQCVWLNGAWHEIRPIWDLEP